MINNFINKINQISITDSDSLAMSDNNKTYKIAIVSSKFNNFIVDNLVKGAIDALVNHNVAYENIELVQVPGALEIPLAIKNLLQTKKYDGLVALGTVIRGSTTHFEHVSSESISGINQLSLEYNTPIGNGVITPENIEQAIERAGATVGNKGYEAAMATLSMIGLVNKIKEENINNPQKLESVQ